jgi:hypothetical protein
VRGGDRQYHNARYVLLQAVRQVSWDLGFCSEQVSVLANQSLAHATGALALTMASVTPALQLIAAVGS